MHAVRSRVGVVSITAGAAVLLALPVVAAGQVPGVDQVVGGVTETAESIAPLPVAPALPALPAPVQAPAPKPPAAAPAPAPAPAAPAPAAAAPAPATAPRQSASAAAPRSAGSPGKASASSASKSDSGGKGGVTARSSSDVPSRASQDDSSDESSGSGVPDPVADLPEDASPDTLPFTGLQLVLIAMAGLVALAGGLVLRRSARTARG
jgi:hypothetical protein